MARRGAGCAARAVGQPAAQTDGRPRQNPAYRPATEKPRSGGAFPSCADTHGLETYDFHVWAEPSPWEIVGGSLRFLAHQAYFRVKCGRAAYHQRCLVFMRGAGATVTDVVGAVPEWVLGGDFPAHPSDWLKYPPQTEGRTYLFAGEHRNRSEGTWRWNRAVGHTYDIYDNGTLTTVHWDDTGGDRDFDDFIVEVAVVRRRRFFDDLVVAQRDAEALRRFTEEVEPKLERADRGYEPDRPAAAP